MTPTVERSGSALAVSAAEGEVCVLSTLGSIGCRGNGVTFEVVDVMQRFRPAVAANGSGTTVVSPDTILSGSRGNTLTFLYTAPARGMISGTVKLDVPSGWSTPSTIAVDDGFVEADHGVVTIDNGTAFGTTIAINAVTLAAGQTLTVTYGSKVGGGPGATAPTHPGNALLQTWSMSQQASPFGRKVVLGALPSTVFKSVATDATTSGAATIADSVSSSLTSGTGVTAGNGKAARRAGTQGVASGDGTATPPLATCAAGCFVATVSGARPATFAGGAAAEVSDGSRYAIMLRDKANEGHYIALNRMEGGIPGAGTFEITNTCGEAGYSADQKLFQVEYHLNDYRNEEQVTFVGKSGTVTIDSIEGARARGRYDITACRELGEGKLETVHLHGTFDVPR